MQHRLSPPPQYLSIRHLHNHHLLAFLWGTLGPAFNVMVLAAVMPKFVCVLSDGGCSHVLHMQVSDVQVWTLDWHWLFALE